MNAVAGLCPGRRREHPEELCENPGGEEGGETNPEAQRPLPAADLAASPAKEEEGQGKTEKPQDQPFEHGFEDRGYTPLRSCQ